MMMNATAKTADISKAAAMSSRDDRERSVTLFMDSSPGNDDASILAGSVRPPQQCIPAGLVAVFTIFRQS
jgi:hypothetical protein